MIKCAKPSKIVPHPDYPMNAQNARLYWRMLCLKRELKRTDNQPARNKLMIAIGETSSQIRRQAGDAAVIVREDRYAAMQARLRARYAILTDVTRPIIEKKDIDEIREIEFLLGLPAMVINRVELNDLVRNA